MSEIRYSYNFMNKRIVIAGKVSKENYLEICKRLKVDYARFDCASVDFGSIQQRDLLPKGETILMAVGKVKPNERASYRIYFAEPTEKSDGDICIQIGG